MRAILASMLLTATLLALAVSPSQGASGKDGSPAVMRLSKLRLSPVPDDLALAEVQFPSSRRRSISHSMGAGVNGMFGSDYLADAAVRRRPHGELIELILLVDRPSALADPASVSLSLLSPPAFGKPVRRIGLDPFHEAGATFLKQPAVGRLPCAIGGKDTVLIGSGLTAIRTRGAPLSGLSSADAVADAYDALCGLSYPASFKAAVDPESPCTQGQTCAPKPVEPHPPGCTPCDPRPGAACPLSGSPDVCVAEQRRALARASSTGAH
jgi:hypothetical protein